MPNNSESQERARRIGAHIYAGRPQKDKDRRSPRVRTFKSKQIDEHGITVEAYGFHEIRTFFNIRREETRSQDESNHQLLNLACEQINADGRIPEEVINSQPLWNEAINSSCKASVLMLFREHLAGRPETLIAKIESPQGFKQLREIQRSYETGWKDRNVTFFAEKTWHPKSSQLIPLDDIASSLIEKEGYYELSFSNSRGTHVIGVVIDQTNAYLMDISRGLVIMAKKDFPQWFNKQSQPANVENRKLSYLRTHFHPNVVITEYQSPAKPAQTNHADKQSTPSESLDQPPKIPSRM